MVRRVITYEQVAVAARENRHALYDEGFWGFSSQTDAQDHGFEEGVKWALEQLGEGEIQ